MRKCSTFPIASTEMKNTAIVIPCFVFTFVQHLTFGQENFQPLVDVAVGTKQSAASKKKGIKTYYSNLTRKS